MPEKSPLKIFLSGDVLTGRGIPLSIPYVSTHIKIHLKNFEKDFKVFVSSHFFARDQLD